MNGWEWVITGYTVAFAVLGSYLQFLRRAEARLKRSPDSEAGDKT